MCCEDLTYMEMILYQYCHIFKLGQVSSNCDSSTSTASPIMETAHFSQNFGNQYLVLLHSIQSNSYTLMRSFNNKVEIHVKLQALEGKCFVNRFNPAFSLRLLLRFILFFVCSSQ